MHIGICAAAAASARVVAGSALDYVEENVQTFLVPEGDEATFRANLRAAALAARTVLAANCFLPAALKCVGPQVDRARIRAYAASAFVRARAAGIDTIVVGSGGARGVPEGFSAATAFAQFVDLLRELGPLAAAQGITLAIEPLNRGECNLINSLAEGAAAARAVGHPGVRLLADLYHMLREDEPPEAIRAVGDLLVHAHIAEKDKRTAPGCAGDDFRPWLRALRATGYDRRLSLECGFGDAAREVGEAVRVIRRQWSEAEP